MRLFELSFNHDKNYENKSEEDKIRHTFSATFAQTHNFSIFYMYIEEIVFSISYLQFSISQHLSFFRNNLVGYVLLISIMLYISTYKHQKFQVYWGVSVHTEIDKWTRIWDYIALSQHIKLQYSTNIIRIFYSKHNSLSDFSSVMSLQNLLYTSIGVTAY